MFLKDSALNRLKEAKVYTFVGRLGKRLLLSCRDRRRGSFQGMQEAASTGRGGGGGGQWGQMGGGDGGSLSEASREAVLTNAGQCPQSASLRSNRVTGES